MNQPAISILIAVHNEETFLTTALESIWNQTFADFECILVDDASNDATPELIAEQTDSRLIALQNKENLGLAQSLNKAAEYAQAPFLCRMDGDDICMPHRLMVQKSYLDAHQETGLIGSAVILIDENGDELTHLNPAPTWLDVQRVIRYNPPCFHPSWMLRREIFERMGGYQNLPATQDYDFLYRCFTYGIKIENVNEYLLKYRVHSKQVSSRSVWIQHYIKRTISNYYRHTLDGHTRPLPKSLIDTIQQRYTEEKTRQSIGKDYFKKAIEAKQRKKMGLMFWYLILSSINPHTRRELLQIGCSKLSQALDLFMLKYKNQKDKKNKEK